MTDDFELVFLTLYNFTSKSITKTNQLCVNTNGEISVMHCFSLKSRSFVWMIDLIDYFRQMIDTHK